MPLAPLFDVADDPPPPCHLFPGGLDVPAADVSPGDESMGQYAVPLIQEESDAYMTDNMIDVDTTEQYVIPLHTPMDVAPTVPPQLANSATDFQELPPPSEQWIRTCVELPGMARGWVPNPLQMHNTML